jgi:RNA polymerase sigma factor (sigma-70 family)
MPEVSIPAMIQRLQKNPAVEGPSSLLDGELIDKFVDSKDPSAFELLVWRHGILVWSVCRRILWHEQDAEDAFQAVFIVLAKKASSVQNRQGLAAWLHRVSVRIAYRLRAKQSKDRLISNVDDPESLPSRFPSSDLHDLVPIIDEEIDRLQEPYRTAFVLCHLQGFTNEEAARKIGCPKGTILSRLSRARDRLQQRLSKRGITLSGLFAFGMTNSSLQGGIVHATTNVVCNSTKPIAMGNGISPTILTLVQGALRTMFWSKIKLVCIVIFSFALLGGGTWGLVNSLQQAEAQDTTPKRGTDKEEKAKKATDLDRLQGTWILTSAITNGKPEEDTEDTTLTFEKEKIRLTNKGKVEREFGFTLDPEKKTIDLRLDSRSMPGIYKLDGDKLTICHNDKGDTRPEKFASEVETDFILLELKREKSTENKEARKERIPDNLEDAKKRISELLTENERLKKELQASLKIAQASRDEAVKQKAVAQEQEQRAQVERLRAEDARAVAERTRQYAEDRAAKSQAELKKLREELDKEKKKTTDKVGK